MNSKQIEILLYGFLGLIFSVGMVALSAGVQTIEDNLTMVMTGTLLVVSAILTGILAWPKNGVHTLPVFCSALATLFLVTGIGSLIGNLISTVVIPPVTYIFNVVTGSFFIVVAATMFFVALRDESLNKK